MTINYIEGGTDEGLRRVLRGHTLVREEFGPQGIGKTTRARKKAEELSRQGKSVVVVDGLVRNGMGGVRVFAKG